MIQNNDMESMRFPLVVVIIMFVSVSAQANNWGKAFADIEDGEFISVFTDPGVDWDTCRQNKGCEAVGWVDRNSDIEIVSDPVEYPSLDYYTKQVVDKKYVQIKFSYDRVNPDGKKATKKDQYGWVEASSIKKEKYATFYGSDPKPEDCPPTLNPPKAVPEVKKATENIVRATENKAVVATADAISPFVGKCVMHPKNTPAKYTGKITYDNYVLPHMKKQAVPNLKKEDGSKVTQQDLIDIDALARTMYSEMASCYAKGLQYPSAVARVAFNRATSPTRKDGFTSGPHAAGKGDIAKAVTKPYQFSVWNRTNEKGGLNPSLGKALCPPGVMNDVIWTGKAIPPYEKDIWKNTVRIATEAVLFPKKFKTRSKDLTQFHYTTAIDRPGFRHVFPTIEGRRVDANSCVRVWQEK